MSKPLIIANWKCNPTTQTEAKRLLNSVRKGIKNVKNVEVVICPPFLYLSLLLGSSTFAQTRRSYGGSSVAFGVGGQDCFWEEKGAFTGEVSPLMLKNLGCKFVIIGHSERRRYLKETDEMINRKLKAVLSRKLKPILCIGETRKERGQGKTQTILKNQLKKALSKISAFNIQNSKLAIAYEPVWAIGTGKACSPREAKKSLGVIKKVISKIYNKKLAKTIKILYGGSVNGKNAASYIFEANFQGLLVGGASLDPREFVILVKAVSRS